MCNAFNLFNRDYTFQNTFRIILDNELVTNAI